MKKVLLVLFMSIFVLFGCSKSGTEEVHLTMMVWDSLHEEGYQQMIDNYEAENPGVTIELQIKPWADYWTSLDTSMQAGNGPDIFWMNAPNMMKYTESGMIAPLNDAVDAAGVDLSTFQPVVTDLYTGEDGNLYAMPQFYDVIGLWYNEKLMADAGVEVPTTWDEMLTACETLKEVYPDKFAFSVPIDPQAGYWNFIVQNGGTIINEDGTSGFTSPEGIEALTLLQEMTAQNYSPGPEDGEFDQMSLIISEQAVMAMDGSWNLKFYAEATNAEDISVAPLPTKTGADGETTSIIHGVGLAANANSENVDVATDFVASTGTDESMEIMATVNGVTPANLNMTDIYLEAYSVIGGIEETLASAENGYVYPMTADASWIDECTEIYSKMLAGEYTPEEAANLMDQSVIDSTSR